MHEPKKPPYTWTIKYLETQNLVSVVVKGDFSLNGHLEMIKDVVSQKFWKKEMNLLIDDRQVEFKGTTIDLVKKISEDFRSVEKEIGYGKMAILMDSLTDYARGRQFELLTDCKVSTDLNIFMDEEKALNWLNS